MRLTIAIALAVLGVGCKGVTVEDIQTESGRECVLASWQWVTYGSVSIWCAEDEADGR